MITGDNPLTACHVGKVLKFCNNEICLILTKEGMLTRSTLSTYPVNVVPKVHPRSVSSSFFDVIIEKVMMTSKL